MNWQDAIEEFASDNGCSRVMMSTASSSPRAFRKLEKKRKTIENAAQAVREAYESDPTADRAAVKKKAMKSITASILLALLLQSLFGALIRRAVEFFLDKLFKSSN